MEIFCVKTQVARKKIFNAARQARRGHREHGESFRSAVHGMGRSWPEAKIEINAAEKSQKISKNLDIENIWLFLKVYAVPG